MVHGVVFVGVVVSWGSDNCMCILPGLVMLDLCIGGGLDGDGEEVVGVVSCEMKIILLDIYPIRIEGGET